PTMNVPEAGADTVTGTGSEPGNTITVTFPDGTTGTGTVGEDGSWSVEVPGGTELNNGDEITAVETDDAGNVSDEGSAIDVDTTTPDASPVNVPVVGTAPVPGTGSEPGNTSPVTFPAGTAAHETVAAAERHGVHVPEATE
ncbi:Ig-like domain-containing protein, partial [Staphylococcus capitis]|uniref:Ig-like domain-containing protein n=1 Tax=Staphylococcus capitis TaxID=29388 RepID=UPI000D4041FF